MAEVQLFGRSAIARPSSPREHSAGTHVDLAGPLPMVQVAMQGKQPIVTNAAQILQRALDPENDGDPSAPPQMISVTMQGKQAVVTGGMPRPQPQQALRLSGGAPAARPRLADGDLHLCKALVAKYLDEQVTIAAAEEKTEATAEAAANAELATATLAAIEAALAPPATRPSVPAHGPMMKSPVPRDGAPPPVIVTMHGKNPIVQEASEGPRPIAVSSARSATERPSRVAPPVARPAPSTPPAPKAPPVSRGGLPLAQPARTIPGGPRAPSNQPATRKLPPPVLPADMPDDLRDAVTKMIPELAPPKVDEPAPPQDAAITDLVSE